MEFPDRKLMKCNSPGRTELKSEETPVPFKEVAHNIVTTVSSIDGIKKSCAGNGKVVIETTVSWARLPQISPSIPVIEIISDNTTDTGGESSDEKENLKSKDTKCATEEETICSFQWPRTNYSEDVGTIPIQSPEESFMSEEYVTNRIVHNNRNPTCNARLAALADTIKHWEDDPRHFPVEEGALGFSQSVSQQRLIFNYKEHERPVSPVKPVTSKPPLPPRKSPVKITSPVKERCGNSVRRKTVFFNIKEEFIKPVSDGDTASLVTQMEQLKSSYQTASLVPVKQDKDPSELTLTERRALFERNAGQPLLPKTPFGIVSSIPKGAEQKTVQAKFPYQHGPGEPFTYLTAFEKGTENNPRMTDRISESQNRLEMLKQRWKKNKVTVVSMEENVELPAPLPTPQLPSAPQPCDSGSRQSFYCSEEEEIVSAYPAAKEITRVKSSPQNQGHLTQDMSDVEVLEEEAGASNRSCSGDSFKEPDLYIPRQDSEKLARLSLKRDWSTRENTEAEINEVGDFLEEALNSSSGDETLHKRSSHSMMKPNAQVRHLQVNLNYSDEADEELEMKLVNQKIEHWQQEVAKQEMYISQATRALDLCYSSFEFSGSTELLEAEKLLLLASQRREALIYELQQLKMGARPWPAVPEHGSIAIFCITLPLRMDVIHHAAKADECYYLLCLVRHNEEVLCSDVMTVPRSLHNGNLLTFHERFTLRDLYDDFKVTIQLYAMTAQHKEFIPHDIKYHINTNKKEANKLKLKPRKAKGGSRQHVAPVSQSSTARSSAFALAGYVMLSLEDVRRTQFALIKNRNTVTNVLEGTIQLQLETEVCADVEHRGFLTMFEDVSGLGVWQRRWCLLKGDKLSYWKYPDDEWRKIPLDTIELSQCTNREVEIVRRDICARPNTLQLMCVRPKRSDDTDSLVVSREGDRITARHWLSADTREERDEWIYHLNKTLTFLNTWGVSAPPKDWQYY